MPKCLHPPCPRQVDDALYCDEHQYEPPWMTNISRESQPSWGPPQSARESAPRGAQPLRLVPIILGVAILAILAIALIVILKLIF